jgi:tetratricopeptide (TPR) repeat protein
VVYRGLGEGEKARSYLDRALALSRSAYGGESLEYADALSEKGGLENVEEAQRIRLRLLPDNDPRLASGFWWLGLVQQSRDPVQAEETFRRGLAVLAKSPTPDRQLELYFHNDIGNCRIKKGDYEGGVDSLRQALRIREEIYPEAHLDRIMGLNNLGYPLTLMGRNAEARPYLEQAFDRMSRFYPGHIYVAYCAQSLGELERREGNLHRARELLEQALARLDEFKPNELGPGGRHEGGVVLETLLSLGLVDEAEGRLPDAIARLGRAHEIFRREPGFTMVPPSGDYARVLRKAGRIAEAERVEVTIGRAGTKP